MVITGVERERPVYKCFQDGQVQLLDVVTNFNTRYSACESIVANFESIICDKNEVTLDLVRPTGVPSMSGVLSKGKYNATLCTIIDAVCMLLLAKHMQWTHVFALKCMDSESVGISLKFVEEVRRNST